MGRDVGLGVLFGVVIVAAAGVYFFTGGRDDGDLVALESFAPAPPVGRPNESPVKPLAKPPVGQPVSVAAVKPDLARTPVRSLGVTAPPRPVAEEHREPPHITPPVADTRREPVHPAPVIPRSVEPPAAPPASGPASAAAEPPRTGEPPLPLVHLVEAGESLSEISKRYYHDSRHADWILKANPEIKDAHQLVVGMKLVIPRPVAAARATPDTPTSPRTPTAASAPASGPSTYTVKSGDTLTRIAARTLGNARRWKEIHALNRAAIGPHPEDIRIGMVLKLPAASAPASRPTKAPVKAAAHHRKAKG